MLIDLLNRASPELRSSLFLKLFCLKITAGKYLNSCCLPKSSLSFPRLEDDLLKSRVLRVDATDVTNWRRDLYISLVGYRWRRKHTVYGPKGGGGLEAFVSLQYLQSTAMHAILFSHLLLTVYKLLYLIYCSRFSTLLFLEECARCRWITTQSTRG